MQWTPAQQHTIEARGKNILVSAAAGSGKTTVLIERIKQLVLGDRIDIDRFLITTFTKAAATEMKEKMERAIRSEIERISTDSATANPSATEPGAASSPVAAGNPGATESGNAGTQPTDPAASSRSGAASNASSDPATTSDPSDSVADLQFLRRQLSLLSQVSIGTFHSFAMGIMKDFFYLTDLEPGFAMGDEIRMDLMRKESLEEVFDRRFAEDSERFRAFLRKYSSDRSDDRLQENILEIYKEMQSIPHYMQWAEDQVGALAADSPMKELHLDRFMMQKVQQKLDTAQKYYQRAALLLEREETGTIYLKARQAVEEMEVLQAKAGQAAADPAMIGQLREAIDSFSPGRMSVTKAEKEAYGLVKEEVADLRKKGKKQLEKIKDNYLARDPEEDDEILRALHEDTEYYLDLIRELEAVYQAKKKDERLIDFDDVMHYAIEILEDDAAAQEYRDRFEYIFIDEYQDSNLLQERIVERIARENNLFMVGDVKQSIYKFRLAEPEIFRDKYRQYRSGEDPNSEKIDLNSNFRSKKTIRDVVNRIFEDLMEGYDEDARLNGDDAPEHPDEPVSLHLIEKKVTDGGAPDGASEEGASGEAPENGDPDGASENGASESGAPTDAPGDAPASEPVHPDDEEELEEFSEAALVAQLIRERIGKTIYDRNGRPRPLGYGDIAVLSRGGKAIAQIERYLNNEGIPAYGETAGGYYETVEIQVFLDLLKVISNPRQDVPLISAMSSMFFGFTPEELARIRIARREGSYHQAVISYGEQGEDPVLRDKIRQMLGQIDLWKEIGRTVPLEELIQLLMYDTGYYDYCSGLPVGRQRISNLRLLLDRAAAYESLSHTGLHGFLAYVDAMKKSGQKVNEASLAGEGEDVVRVMTVHKSKGLEFPLVILTGAGKKATSKGAGRSPVMHKEFSIGLPQVDRDQHWERKTLLQQMIGEKKKDEDLEEEIRILYVALTRPMDELAIVGSIDERSKLKEEIGYDSFVQMIWPTMDAMAKEDPRTAQIRFYSGVQTAGGNAPFQPDAVSPGAAQAPSDDPSGAPEPADPAGVSGSANSAGVPDPADPAPSKALSASAYDRTPEEQERLAAEISRRLSFRYPYEHLQHVRSKYSVTELNRMASGSAESLPVRIPALRDFEEAKAGLTAAEAGTVMHTIMERIDFRQALEEGLPYIRSAAEKMRDDGILTETELTSADLENIDAFFRDPVGRKAALAPVLHREKEFLLQKEVDGVPAVVQGIIDCWYEDEDGIVLIDYKNSRLGNETDEETIIERYRDQIRLYREALEEALGRPVRESWLYLFRSRTFVPVD